jgi:tryptophan-rich sensory protein
LLVAAAAALAVGATGGTLTRIGPWYRALVKPAWTPPDPAFGAIWTAIFALTAIAGVLAWRAAQRPATREWLIGLFALNGLFNILWSTLFFALERPDWALVEVAALWLSIAGLIAFAWPLSRKAALLLAPYLVWVSIASLLNYEVVRLNGPFG